MKKFTKWLSLLLAVVMCVSVLAACKPPVTTDPTQGPNPTQGPKPTEGDKPTEPTPTEPTNPVEIVKFTQSPYIVDVMGITVPVEDRLPVEADVMVENAGYLEVGVFGGTLKRAADGGNWSNGKPIEEGLFRFTTQGTIEPNVAKGYDVSADGKVYTIYLREGMRWSDGHPFTAEDCVWFYNAICQNKIDSKGIRNCHKDSNGDPAVVEKVDDYTFTVTFGTPKYDFIEALTVDLKWHYMPKHIFEAFVNAAIAGDNDLAKAEAMKITGREYKDAADAGKKMLYYFWNEPGIPTLNPYVLSTEEGKNNVKGEYYEYIRNPYYWKVDVQGQQLPYIDKIVGVTVENDDQALLLLLDGTIDFKTISMEQAETVLNSNNVNVYEWSGADWGDVGTQLHFNLGIADEKLNALFNNPAFREAMSICVDREVVAGIYGGGWLNPGQAAPQKGALGYSEEWATKWTEYDVAKAKSLFEQAGLKMGSDGFYDFADGTDFALNIESVAESGAAETYKILEPYFRAAGIKCTFKDAERTIIDNKLLEGTIEAMLFPVTGIGDISIALKPNSMVPGYATNVAWYGAMNRNLDKADLTGDLLKLVELKEQLDKTGDAAEREAICLQMLQLHEKNQWTIAYVAASTTMHAVNDRIHNFLADGVWSDIYRDMGIAHCQCWFIPADQQ